MSKREYLKNEQRSNYWAPEGGRNCNSGRRPCDSPGGGVRAGDAAAPAGGSRVRLAARRRVSRGPPVARAVPFCAFPRRRGAERGLGGGRGAPTGARHPFARLRAPTGAEVRALPGRLPVRHAAPRARPLPPHATQSKLVLQISIRFIM